MRLCSDMPTQNNSSERFLKYIHMSYPFHLSHECCSPLFLSPASRDEEHHSNRIHLTIPLRPGTQKRNPNQNPTRRHKPEPVLHPSTRSMCSGQTRLSPFRYLLAMCSGGQLSNRLACIRQNMLDAAIMNRTLILPTTGIDYNYHNLLGGWRGTHNLGI